VRKQAQVLGKFSALGGSSMVLPSSIRRIRFRNDINDITNGESNPENVEEELREIVGNDYCELTELDRIILVLAHQFGDL
jgi:hypothetical protein